MTNTREVVTPVGNQTVVIREWITGRDREYIDAAASAMQAKPKIVGTQTVMDMQPIDMGELMTNMEHRRIEKFVVSVDGNTENVLEAILDMHEDDYTFIKGEIDQKKKAEPNQSEQPLSE